jgi:hypothetical protein
MKEHFLEHLQPPSRGADGASWKKLLKFAARVVAGAIRLIRG